MRKKVQRKVKRAVTNFFQQEASSGMTLLVCAVVAMLIANTSLGPVYEHLLHTELALGPLSMSLLHWINDGLMAIFFFVIGLEIKREFLFGELKSPSATILPIAAAAGGMAVPALFFAAFNMGLPSISGWGVPMATDIAFSLGILAFAAPKAPRAVVVFLTALALVDDLGGILVIAIFYSSELQLSLLLASLVVMALLFLACKKEISFFPLYIAGGLILWYLFLRGGIHPTIAGVILGLSIPAGTEVTHTKSLLSKVEHRLTPWSAYGVMPIFALSNAGISLISSSMATFASPISLGILAGLFLGKPIGIFGMTWILIKSRIATLPHGVKLGHFLGAGMLGGIGFTMSLFIAALAFPDAGSLNTAKLAIVSASVLSGIAGALVLKRL